MAARFGKRSRESPAKKRAVQPIAGENIDLNGIHDKQESGGMVKNGGERFRGGPGVRDVRFL
jgi:hypothetical protein